MISAGEIKKLSEKYFSKVIAIRRHLHSHPELSFQEYATSEYVCSILRDLKIEFKSGIAGTGIIAHINGKNPESGLKAFRADLDALPIHEKNEVEYKSCNTGVMHACGHDVHTACLLGAAMILQETRDKWKGTIRMIFQPGEEQLPGGASLMINEGALENPRPEFIIGQHVFPELEAGKVGFRKGMYMASTDELFLTVKGKGGHAALPSQYTNPILIAASILLRLQNEFMHPEIQHPAPTVLAFGKIEGAGATNVIPSEVKLEGTFRTMNETWRTIAHERMMEIASSVAAEFGGSVDFEIKKGYPFLVNDLSTTQMMIDSAREYLGAENVVELDLRMTAEDFAWYSQVLPSCFYRLGTRNESKGIISPVHTATFDVDENAMLTGMGLLAFAASR